jgi:sec-independent protein translocase protein TatC
MTDELEEEQFEEKPFLEHLEDLRMTLLKIIVATILGAVVCLAVSRQIFSLLTAPIRRYARMVSVFAPPQVAEGISQPERASPPPGPPKPSTDVSSPGTRVVVTGPLGAFLMLARDVVVYSREALSLAARHANKPDDPKRVSPDNPDKSPKPVAPDKKGRKGSSPKEKRPPPAVTIMETGPTMGFIVVLKTSFICGLGATLPLSIFFLAQFVFPALTRKEKRYVTPSFLIGGVLFVIGLLFGYFLTLPLAIRVFVELNRRYGIENVWKMSEYLGTVVKLLIANGVVFEMPLLLIVLVRIGVLSVSTLRKKRKHAIVIILFVAAILTPTDAATMFMLGIPMVVMYEACIWISWLMMRKKRRREEEEEKKESYWQERRKIARAEKVKPAEEEKKPPDEQPVGEGDSGPPPEEDSEGYPFEDESGPQEPPYGGESWQDDLGPDYPSPEEPPKPDEADENPDRGGD